MKDKKEAKEEISLVVIKPSAVRRKLVGKILNEFEEDDFELVDIKMKRLTREEAEYLYDVHKGKDFFEPLIEYMISGPVVAFLLKGKDAIKRVREKIGATDPKEAKPGTVRAKYGLNKRQNAVHAVDSQERLRHEIKVFFDGYV